MCHSTVSTVPYNVSPSQPDPTTPGVNSGSELPPPYTVNGGAGGQTMFVQCRVCQHVIHVGSGSQTRVVKCGNCREATVSHY